MTTTMIVMLLVMMMVMMKMMLTTTTMMTTTMMMIVAVPDLEFSKSSFIIQLFIKLMPMLVVAIMRMLVMIGW